MGMHWNDTSALKMQNVGKHQSKLMGGFLDHCFWHYSIIYSADQYLTISLQFFVQKLNFDLFWLRSSLCGYRIK